MRGSRQWMAVVTVCAVAAAGCGDGGEDSTGGTGGGPGVTPGLWVGSFDTTDGAGWDVCLYVNETGDALQAAISCGIQGGPFSIDLVVQDTGADPNGEACSFDVQTNDSITIRSDGSFAFQNDDGVITSRIEGQFAGGSASGSARASGIPMIESCFLEAWTASPANP
ncbi:MAG: hypothetical protein AAF997_20180 [Myxococcota bacterium]